MSKDLCNYRVRKVMDMFIYSSRNADILVAFIPNVTVLESLSKVVVMSVG